MTGQQLAIIFIISFVGAVVLGVAMLYIGWKAGYAAAISHLTAQRAQQLMTASKFNELASQVPVGESSHE